MHDDFEKSDTRSFRFYVIFLICSIILIALAEIGSAAGFNSYFSNKVGTLFRNPSLALSGGPQKVSADEYMVMDMQSGAILADRDPDGIRPIASITKLMTALVAVRALDLSKKITVSEQAAAAYPEADFIAGEQWVTSDLLYPLLMESSNDAASVLAETYPIKIPAINGATVTDEPVAAEQAYAETAFVAKMNASAAALGMKNTHFVEPSGLSENNVSSASDLLKLTSSILKNQPVIFDLTKTKAKTVVTSDGTFEFSNINVFGDDPTFVGGKIGYTPDAGETMLAVFRPATGPETGHTIGIVVLGSADRVQDISNILAWLEQTQAN